MTLWISLDHSTVNSGCMFYGPRTHAGALRPHERGGEGLPPRCEGKEAECVYLELPPGSAGAHAGRTLHYSRGNKTGDNRRAYVLNFRPYESISQFRAAGFDHGRAGHGGVQQEAAGGGGGGGGGNAAAAADIYVSL